MCGEAGCLSLWRRVYFVGEVKWSLARGAWERCTHIVVRAVSLRKSERHGGRIAEAPHGL